MNPIRIAVAEGDALTYTCDLLALKHADALYGVDEAAVRLLTIAGKKPSLPLANGFTLIESKPPFGARHTLFVGVGPLRGFLYREIRSFGARVLAVAAGAVPTATEIALTLHGVGYGLDEREAFESEIAGLVDAISTGECPSSLSGIAIVERNPARAQRLKNWLNELLPAGLVDLTPKALLTRVGATGLDTLRNAGIASSAKPHAFVAMPFAQEMEDVFYFGIQPPVNSHDLLCERADLSSFTGDVVDYVRTRISTAALVIADLTSANANVYLEVGYAWGKSKPTILLVRDPSELKFDVRSQRCLVYKTIRHLASLLTAELSGLVRS